jgi:hypothetical protein
MFKVKNQDGRNAPLLICDICGQCIEDGALAGVIYEKTGNPLWSDVHVGHKGQCLDSLEHRLGDKYDGWEELYRFLSFITHNVQLKGEDIDEAL